MGISIKGKGGGARVTIDGKPVTEKLKLKTREIVKKIHTQSVRNSYTNQFENKCVAINKQVLIYRITTDSNYRAEALSYNDNGSMSVIADLTSNKFSYLISGFNNNCFDINDYDGEIYNIIFNPENKNFLATLIQKETRRNDIAGGAGFEGDYLYYIMWNPAEINKFDLKKGIKTLICRHNIDEINYIRNVFEYDNNLYYVQDSDNGLCSFNKFDMEKLTFTKMFDINDISNGWYFETSSAIDKKEITFLMAKENEDGITYKIKRKKYNLTLNTFKEEILNSNLINERGSIIEHLDMNRFSFYHFFNKDSKYVQATGNISYLEENSESN